MLKLINHPLLVVIGTGTVTFAILKLIEVNPADSKKNKQLTNGTNYYAPMYDMLPMKTNIPPK